MRYQHIPYTTPLHQSFTGKHGNQITIEHTPEIHSVWISDPSQMWDEEDLTTLAAAWLRSLGWSVKSEEVVEENRRRHTAHMIAIQELPLEPKGGITCDQCGQPIPVTHLKLVDGV